MEGVKRFVVGGSACAIPRNGTDWRNRLGGSLPTCARPSSGVAAPGPADRRPAGRGSPGAGPVPPALPAGGPDGPRRTTAASFQTAQAPIEVRTPEELVAVADPKRLAQALENLLANARTHSPQGAPITLELGPQTRAGQAWVTFTVSDQGPGIAPEVLPRLFTRFASGTESDGLGLFLAHEIAAAHGGSLTVDSRPGQGTRFTLALPVAPASGDGSHSAWQPI